MRMTSRVGEAAQRVERSMAQKIAHMLRFAARREGTEGLGGGEEEEQIDRIALRVR